jgi:hypothetical protein
MNHTKKLEGLSKLKKLCQGAVVFGFVTSAGGNVLHAMETSQGQHWGFRAISVGLAILIPAIFGLMFEIATRVIFRKEAALLMKLIAFMGSGGISAITAWNSYFHQRDAFSHFGDVTQATLLPLAIDGLMIIGSVYLIELGFQIRDLEAYIAAPGLKKTKEDTPVPSKKDKEPTGKERVTAAWYSAPNLTVKELAKLAGTSETYAYNIVSQLRKLVETSTDLEGAVA